MPYTNPFAIPGNWYRGNTHTHTTVSDGRLTLPDRVAAYREKGYDFLAITDHGAVSDVSAFSDDQFLVISGSELHPANTCGGDVYHIVALNVHTPIAADKLTANEVIAEITRQGGAAVVAHPYWCGHTINDLSPLQGYFATEVFNATCTYIGRGYSEQSWDELLDHVGPVVALAVDDAHGDVHDTFQGWVMVKAPALTTADIMTALTSGAFYATQGPELNDITISTEQTANGTQQRMRVKCSPVRSIDFKCRRACGHHVVAPRGGSLTEAEYIIPVEYARYVRVEITDDHGLKAWSNPMFV